MPHHRKTPKTSKKNHEKCENKVSEPKSSSSETNETNNIKDEPSCKGVTLKQMSNKNVPTLKERNTNYQKSAEYENRMSVLSKILHSNSDDVAVYLVQPKNQLILLLTSQYDDVKIASLLLDIISKACSSSYCGCNEYIANIAVSSPLWLSTVPSLIISVKDNSEFVNSVFSAAEIMYKATSNLDVINHIHQMILGVPEDVKEITRCKLKILEEKQNVTDWGIDNSDYETDNYRHNENIFPCYSDLDNAYAPFTRANVLSGSYGTIDNYLDTYFYLIREKIINYFRKIINIHWSHKYEKIEQIHTDVTVTAKLFLVDGTHFDILFPISNYQQDGKDLFPGQLLCISDDNFVTLYFVHIHTVYILDSEHCKLDVILISSDSDSLVVGCGYAFVKGDRNSSFQVKILKALRMQKTVALENLIVNVENSLEPPVYMDQSVVMDFSPLSIENSFESVPPKMIKVLDTWPPYESFSVNPIQVQAYKDIFQRQLSVVNVSHDLSKSFCLHLLHVFDVNKMIWQKDRKAPVLLICNSDQMLAELTTKIVKFTESPLVLCDDNSLKKKNNTEELEKMATDYGKKIENILQDIALCAKSPLDILRVRQLSNCNDGYGLWTKNQVFKWLCLTPETCAVYEQTPELISYYEKLIKEYTGEKYTIEHFKDIATHMFRVKDIMKPSEVENIDDIWSLDLTSRWNLIRYWKGLLVNDLINELNDIKLKYNQTLNVLNDLSSRSDWLNLAHSTVVCATSHNAIKKIDILNKIKPIVVIVIESHEIPESYLIPYLGKHTEHVILIGSGKQPFLVNREYDITVSLYERLLANGIPYSDLTDKHSTKETVNYSSYQNYQRKPNSWQKLSCGHLVELPYNDIQQVLCQQLTYYTLKCGHRVRIPCFETGRVFQCNELVTEVLSCNHEITYICSQKNAIDLVCMKTKKVLLPCSHEVEIRCCELNEKQSEYFEKGCYKKCSIILKCNHPCYGKCANCVSLAVHQSCQEKCNLYLSCGHYCQGKCGAPCPPCSLHCEWECPHMRCDKMCADLCSLCDEPCSWACPHMACKKKCWQKCDRPLCDKPCDVLLMCGHKCVGICGEPCPSLCKVCDVAKYEELCLQECSQIIELDCGHMFNRIMIINMLDEFFQLKVAPVCPLCSSLMKGSGYIGTRVRAWHRFLHGKKGIIKDMLTPAIKTILYDPKIIIAQHSVRHIDNILNVLTKRNDLYTFFLSRTHIHFIFHLSETRNKIMSLTLHKPELYELKTRCENLINWLGNNWTETSFRQIDNISWETHRIRQLCVLYQRKLKMKKFVNHKEIYVPFIKCEKAINVLQKAKFFNYDHDTKLKKILKQICDADKRIGNILLNHKRPINKDEYNKWQNGIITEYDINWKLDED